MKYKSKIKRIVFPLIILLIVSIIPITIFCLSKKREGSNLIKDKILVMKLDKSRNNDNLTSQENPIFNQNKN